MNSSPGNRWMSEPNLKAVHAKAVKTFLLPLKKSWYHKNPQSSSTGDSECSVHDHCSSSWCNTSFWGLKGLDGPTDQLWYDWVYCTGAFAVKNDITAAVVLTGLQKKSSSTETETVANSETRRRPWKCGLNISLETTELSHLAGPTQPDMLKYIQMTQNRSSLGFPFFFCCCSCCWRGWGRDLMLVSQTAPGLGLNTRGSGLNFQARWERSPSSPGTLSSFQQESHCCHWRSPLVIPTPNRNSKYSKFRSLETVATGYWYHIGFIPSHWWPFTSFLTCLSGLNVLQYSWTIIIGTRLYIHFNELNGLMDISHGIGSRQELVGFVYFWEHHYLSWVRLIWHTESVINALSAPFLHLVRDFLSIYKLEKWVLSKLLACSPSLPPAVCLPQTHSFSLCVLSTRQIVILDL